MDFEDLVFKTRSYRRFDEEFRVNTETLRQLVNLARLSPSAANRQPLKYILCNSRKKCDLIFPSLAWAGYLKEWGGPAKGERPSAYIVILGDTAITGSFGVDSGIAAQTIMLGATNLGLGGCMIASIKKDKLRADLNIPEKYEILLVLALGKPVEKVVIEDLKGEDFKYWRDDNQVHHVPKRSLDDLIISFE
ncbi:MAG: nitroreductase family protein [Bacteroidales bacterium]|nr:nitroreductase family protein [Bacteroidales bacterium]